MWRCDLLFLFALDSTIALCARVPLATATVPLTPDNGFVSPPLYLIRPQAIRSLQRASQHRRGDGSSGSGSGSDDEGRRLNGSAHLHGDSGGDEGPYRDPAEAELSQLLAELALRRRCRLEEEDQAALESARALWDSHVDALELLAAQRAEQFSAMVLQAAACAGFTMSAFMELNWYSYSGPPPDPSPLVGLYALLSAATVGIMMCTLTLAFILNIAAFRIPRSHGNAIRESAFIDKCVRVSADGRADGRVDSPPRTLSVTCSHLTLISRALRRLFFFCRILLIL